MADFKVEVPIRVEGKGGGSIAKEIGDSIRKALKGVGFGGGTGALRGGALAGGAASGGGAGGKGILGLVKGIGFIGIAVAALLAIISALDFIIKPIMNLLKALIMILFLPLIPIIKPIFLALGKFIKWLMPIMKKVQEIVQKVVDWLFGGGVVDFVKNFFGAIWEALVKSWEVILMAGQWIWENVLVPAFSFLGDVGIWIWEQILLPAFLVLGDLGLRIWEVIKSLFKGYITVYVTLWGWFKELFKGAIQVGSVLWGWFKTLFKGTISVASTVWNWFKGLFRGRGGSGSSSSARDFILRPNGQIIQTATDDFLIGTKNPEKLFGNGGGQTVININNPIVREEADIRKLTNMISRELQSQMKRRQS